MKIFIAGPETKILEKNNIVSDYVFENVLESYFYVKKNIEKKYKDVQEYNEKGRKNG